MATIRQSASSKTFILESEHTVGRSNRSGLHIPDRRVSSQHAVIRWTGGIWEVKDLGSRNGTFLNSQRLKRGEGVRLQAGAALAFGVADNQWEFVDDSPPNVMIVPLDGGRPVHLADGLLAVPSVEDPQSTIYRSADGNWFLESENASQPIALRNQQLVELGSRMWRFSAPEQVWTTSLSDQREWELRTIEIQFTVSLDEEHVSAKALVGDQSVDLGWRNRHYLLLTLARRRIEDAAQGLDDSDCGWIDQDELAHDPSMSGSQLNIDVFRIRRQFANINVSDPANIIERRPRAKQLRIGTGRIKVSRVGKEAKS